jgi:hypothetical protein
LEPPLKVVELLQIQTGVLFGRLVFGRPNGLLCKVSMPFDAVLIFPETASMGSGG